MESRNIKKDRPTQSVLEGWVEEGVEITDLLVPAEFNHEVFPLASTSLNPEEKLLTFTVKTALPDGRMMERTLEVEGSPRLGLPGVFDQEVYAGVMALAERKGGLTGDGTVRFSLYELKEILHLPTNAENYRKLRDSLMRWQRTSLTTQGAVYLADTEEYASGLGYNMWAVKWARDSRPGRAKTELNEVKFHEFFIRNYRAGYIKSIDWDFWLSLGRGIRGGTLKRLYRLIDAERGGTLEWRTTVQSLMGQVPIPPSYKYPGKGKTFLERHHPDLVKRGFLEVAEISDDYEVYYRVDPRFVGRQRHLSLAEDPRDRAAIERLISFRMREKEARRLVAFRGAPVCQRYMDALPYQKNVSRPAGWLKTYIEGAQNGPFPPKHGFAPATVDAPAMQVPVDATRYASTAEASYGPQETYDVAPPPRSYNETTDAPLDDPVSFSEIPFSPTQEQQRRWDLEGDVRRRFDAGEFDKTVAELEGLDAAQYTRFVAAKSPIVDAQGNRYYLSLEGALYLYVGSAELDNRVLLTTLDRG